MLQNSPPDLGATPKSNHACKPRAASHPGRPALKIAEVPCGQGLAASIIFSTQRRNNANGERAWELLSAHHRDKKTRTFDLNLAALPVRRATRAHTSGVAGCAYHIWQTATRRRPPEWNYGDAAAARRPRPAPPAPPHPTHDRRVHPMGDFFLPLMASCP